jgi:ABC-type amino acid transport system permease subunit
VRTLCAVVLVFEAIVIGLAIPIAINLEGADPALAGGVWGGMALAALVLSGLQKRTWAHYAAWVLQAAFLFTSFMVTGAPLVAIVFVSLWVTAVILGRKVDQTRAAHAAYAEAMEGSEVPEAGQASTPAESSEAAGATGHARSV